MPIPAVPVVLVTGFEPFGGDTVNPSWEVARRLDGWLVERGDTGGGGAADSGGPGNGVLAVVQAELLPCIFHAALDVLNAAIDRYRPVAVVGLGLAGSRRDISVERIAINVDDARIPDNAGCQPIDQPVHPRAPAAYWSTLPIKAIVGALQDAGIAASVSQTAGTFVCNHVFFGLAHSLASRRRRAPPAAKTGGSGAVTAALPRGGFIHVPWPAEEQQAMPGGELDLETMVQAIRIAVRVTLTTRTDRLLGGGALE